MSTDSTFGTCVTEMCYTINGVQKFIKVAKERGITVTEHGDTRVWLTIEEVAEKLEVHERTIRGYIKRKELRAVKVGGRWRISTGDVQAFLDRRANMEVPAA